MKAVLPGKPAARLQALSTGVWDSRRIIAYISGNALAILGDHDTLLQTIYDDNDHQALEAVAVDDVSGKIAACSRSAIRIYQPIGQHEDALQWALQSTLSLGCEDGTLGTTATSTSNTSPTLSWGCSEELLVGSSCLALYCTASPPTCAWRKQLPIPARCAAISSDSAYIASIGSCDALVKVWRRLNFGSDDVRFDFVYLRHPDVVTGLEWRKPYHVDHTVETILYTFCADHFLRVWTRADGCGSQNLRLWGKIDLAASVPNAGLDSAAGRATRWAFIIQGVDLSAATEKAVQEDAVEGSSDSVALQHLINVANRSSEICVVLDARGGMSALSLENVGSKAQKTIDVSNIAQVTSEDLDFARGLRHTPNPHVEIRNYCDRASGHLHLLVHFFPGEIEVYEANVVRLFDETRDQGRLWPKCVWSGHSAPVQKMVRNFSGQAVFSRTEEGEGVLWKHVYSEGRISLAPHSLMPAGGRRIHRICVLRKGRFVALLLLDRISLWDCRRRVPALLATCEYTVSGRPLCLLILPRQRAEDPSVAHLATVTSHKCGIVWEVALPAYSSAVANASTNGQQEPSIFEFRRFELPDAGDLAYVLPVDPAGSSPVISGFLDVFARDVAISYTRSGRVEFWTARINRGRGGVEWLSTSSMETGVPEPALVSGSTMKKAALVNSDRSSVTIWDVRGARLEYAGDFEGRNSVQDLDWTSTPDSQCILAVGFPHRVLLLAQMRFDYLNQGPAWAPLREINIRGGTPHPIGDSTWLGDGHLVIGAGHQLFVYDRSFDASGSLITSLRLPERKGGMWDLFDAVQRLNGPLPVFHPQFLSQCMLAGKSSVVQRILTALHRTLKFWVPGEPVDDYLGMDTDIFYTNGSFSDASGGEREPASYFARRLSLEGGEEGFSEETAHLIGDKLTKVALPQLSGHEQMQLVDIVECVGLVEKQRRSMDENGARFMLFSRQHALRKGRANEIHMSWREINWAYHSTSQDVLVDFVSRQHHGGLLWESARESGMFMWLTDPAAVRAQFEAIARNQYTKSDMKNPVDCSLFYLALKKKAVLQGLWRMAGWNREQHATQKLLSNNFNDPKWRTTALKNAYALMSKRRFEYAAAFFLLADHLADAVNVCLNQLKDLQLAITIARVYEGDQGPTLRRLLEEEVLAVAAQEGNRWLASWAFWMLHRRDMAVRALITPVYTLLETPCSPDIKSRLFLTDDPALVVLYSQLRQKTLQTLRGASKVTPKVEWEFVLHNARLYDRMGCDLLGLDLVRNWEFLRSAAAPGFGGEVDPLQMLRRRSSLVVADLPVSVSPASGKLQPGEGRLGGRPQQAPPTVFEEPDMNSFLDGFGT